MSAKIIEMKAGSFDNGALAAICVDTDGELKIYEELEESESNQKIIIMDESVEIA